MSKGTIPLGKVVKIQIQEHKKKFIFEMHTSVEGRVYYIQADTEAVLKDWVDAITNTWLLHSMKYVRTQELDNLNSKFPYLLRVHVPPVSYEHIY